jgi:hypothetical protein
MRVHPRARTEHLERDGPTLQLPVREPPATGGPTQPSARLRSATRVVTVTR